MTYRERQEAKAERLRGWADKRVDAATAAWQVDEHLRGDWAFATQPGRIPARDRMNARDERTFASIRKADQMESRADGIQDQLDHSIYSDDPDAIERLQEKVAKLEAKRDACKAANVAYRKEHAVELKMMSAYERSRVIPAPIFHLAGISSEIKRAKDRIADIQRKASADYVEPGRYLHSLKRAGTCCRCEATLEQGKPALWFRDAGEIACVSCEATS